MMHSSVLYAARSTRHAFGRRIAAGLLCLLALAWSGCGWVPDHLDACAPKYLVQFVADKNLNFADAFEQEVEDVTVYVYDEEDRLILTQTASGADLKPTNGSKYAMNLSDLAPGKYHIVAWGNLLENEQFTIPSLELRSELTDMICTLTRTSRADAPDLVTDRLTPLFHGTTDIEIAPDVIDGVYRFTVNLTKDTNEITVVLQQLDSTPMNVEDFDFAITANNGRLNHDNTLRYDEAPFIYTAYQLEAGTAGVLSAPTPRSEETAGYATLVAHLSTSRLVLTDRAEAVAPTLTITNSKTGNTILSVPLIDYVLMVRSHYTRVTSSQDYLDRQSDYSMTFFILNGQWMNSYILINDWTVRLQDEVIQ
jgi:hypothetical protein